MRRELARDEWSQGSEKKSWFELFEKTVWWLYCVERTFGGRQS